MSHLFNMDLEVAPLIKLRLLEVFGSGWLLGPRPAVKSSKEVYANVHERFFAHTLSLLVLGDEHQRGEVRGACSLSQRTILKLT